VTPARRQEVADIRSAMNRREGRRFIWRLLGMSQLFLITNSTNSADAFRAEGRRLIGQTLLADIFEFCPEQFPLMQAEARQDAETESLRNQDHDND